jgi:hypothetical protein
MTTTNATYWQQPAPTRRGPFTFITLLLAEDPHLVATMTLNDLAYAITQACEGDADALTELIERLIDGEPYFLPHTLCQLCPGDQPGTICQEGTCHRGICQSKHAGRAELRRLHSHGHTGNPRRDYCSKDNEDWPCAVTRLLAALDRAEDSAAAGLWKQLCDDAGIRPGDDEPWSGGEVVPVLIRWLREHGVDTEEEE